MKKLQKLIEQLVSFAQQKNQGKNFEKFIRIFFAEITSHDFLNYSIEDLYNSALSSFNFIAERNTEGPKIKIHNPCLEKNGFESHYTLLEIVNDDMPFLVDSTVSYLDKYGLKIANIVHPIISVTRDKNGKLIEISTEKDAKKESVIHLHLEKITSVSDMATIQENIKRILKTVYLTVGDWQAMIALARKAQSQLANVKTTIKSPAEISEIKEFISWVINGNFVFLGAKEFNIKEVEGSEYNLEEVQVSGFGIFRSEYEELRPEVQNSSFEEVDDSVKNPYIIEILKSRYRSRVHRSANAERIRIQKISADGKIIGEFRFIGLFSSSVYYESASSIPLIRGKVAKVIADSGYIKGGHNYKDLISAIESYPRDDLFQISDEDLLRNTTGIVSICGRSQVRFFARKDKFNRFVSCLIYMPRNRSNTEVREKIKNYLAEIYSGEVADSFLQLSDSNLIRMHLIIRTDKLIPHVDELMVENEIIKMTKIWSDDLQEAVKAKFGDEKRFSFFSKYKNAFSISYANRFDARRAAIEIEKIEQCLEKQSILFNLYRSSDLLPDDVAEFKIYSPDKELILSEIMPLLESFGFNVIQEHTYIVNIENDDRTRGKKKVWIHYFHMNLSKSGHKFTEKIKLNFEKTISLICKGITEVGFLNKLVVAADLNWKQIYMLRAYARYLYQSGFRYSKSHMADVFVRYSELTKLLVGLFEAKFDPSFKEDFSERKKEIEVLSEQISMGLNEVRDASDDAVLRRFFNAIQATLRTNYYQNSKTGGFKGYLSFKFDSHKLPDLPLPVPYAEIFVYSPRVEAIHLRGGKVARGGLRWSDRHEDFRTEVLGLMKAQMTKNAVIVPVGSKGGFVVKSNTSSFTRDELQKEGIECYKTFLRGLLDVTDNVLNGKIEHPQHVVRYDEADPYLVVAADKGTATFSDIANSISAEYNFWLGDAFASGGSAGYDHKKMGITAKGGWISVMRHFREMGIDTQTQDFTCVGIGDLGGDVFGNGMLLSKHIKLIAAFNHMHIFLDPNPDAEKSFIERQRIFNLPRSTWLDYNPALLSQGGAIFERSAKSLQISPEIKFALAIEKDELTPHELIRAILKAPVDLLWNGGIGTYVKASDETDQEVGDRANDLLRVNGADLRCKVVGEGGNLGFTQRGRIEYALNKGRINTDAMDNSAGVDCSDHEVNIKIALIAAMRSNKINFEERNKVLESMTDEVSHLVLNDNRLQTQAISIAESLSYTALGDQAQFLDKLEKSGLLNREIEFLPNKKEINRRSINKLGLARPELCVMLAYSKMSIYNQLLGSDLVKDEYFTHELFSYFPQIMQKQFADEISSHQLRKEIIATQITNFVVNRLGITFVNQISYDNGFSIPDVVRCLIIACDSFGLREVWEEIEALDGKIAAHVQMQMFLSANKLCERSVMWLLRNQPKGEIRPVVERFRKIAKEISGILPEVLAQDSRDAFEKKAEGYRLNNVDQKLAFRIASMDPIASIFDIAEILSAYNYDLKTIAKLYFAIGTRFSLKWLRNRVSEMDFGSYWQKLSSKTILEDLYYYQLHIAKSVVNFGCNEKQKLCEISTIEAWIKTVEFLVERFDNFIADLKEHPSPDLSVFMVALNRLKPLIK